MPARVDNEGYAVFSGQIIVPRDPAFNTTVLMKKQTIRLAIFIFACKIAKRRYSVCGINLINILLCACVIQNSLGRKTIAS